MTRRHRHTYTRGGNLLFVRPPVNPLCTYRVMTAPELLEAVAQETDEKQASQLYHMAAQWEVPNPIWLLALDYLIEGNSLSEEALIRLQTVRDSLIDALFDDLGHIPD